MWYSRPALPNTKAKETQPNMGDQNTGDRWSEFSFTADSGRIVGFVEDFKDFAIARKYVDRLEASGIKIYEHPTEGKITRKAFSPQILQVIACIDDPRLLADPAKTQEWVSKVRSAYMGTEQTGGLTFVDKGTLDDSKSLHQQISYPTGPRPDLRTLEGARYLVTDHEPDEATLHKRRVLNSFFGALIDSIWPVLPEGPGKTVAIRAINRARMECNSCIANGGQ